MHLRNRWASSHSQMAIPLSTDVKTHLRKLDWRCRLGWQLDWSGCGDWRDWLGRFGRLGMHVPTPAAPGPPGGDTRWKILARHAPWFHRAYAYQ